MRIMVMLLEDEKRKHGEVNAPSCNVLMQFDSALAMKSSICSFSLMLFKAGRYFLFLQSLTSHYMHSNVFVVAVAPRKSAGCLPQSRDGSSYSHCQQLLPC
ncbi:hypothetical protein GOODEAATRI_017210 [Goodea atripinnis]|uniref:Uncharacterized protein n=1 Tax=Goodea atripinnis TaxID=208336 RepID=A0ABV0NEL0_9TELE